MAAYDTPLNAADETQFQSWKQQYAPKDSGADYDLRGAFKAGLKPDAQTGHWPDTFKKPNHPTFSNESKYAKDAPDKAGHWEGDTYIPPVPAGFSLDAPPPPAGFTVDAAPSIAPAFDPAMHIPTEGGVASAPKPAAVNGKVPRHNTPQEKALDASRTGRVLDAVGQGLKDGWGAEPIGLSPESEKFLKDAGIFNSTQGSVMSPLRAFNEIMIRPAAAAIDTVMRGMNAATFGLAGLVGANVGEATGKKGMDWDAARDTLAIAQTFGIVGGFREGPVTPRAARPVAVETPPITGPRNALTIADEHATAVMTEDTRAMLSTPSPAGDFGPQRASLEDAQAAADATPRRPAAPVVSDLVVARQMPDGTVKYGKPGGFHSDLMEPGEDIPYGTMKRQMGFAQPGGPFMSRQEALQWVSENQPGREERTYRKDRLEAADYYDTAKPPEQPRVMAAERTDAPQTPHQIFSEPESTTVIDKAGNIRLDNADWSEGAKSVFRQVAEENGGPDAFLDARRGVQTLALREQAADAMGTDASWLLSAKKGQAFNDAEIEYATRIAVQSANDTFEAMRKAGRPDAAEADILRYAELKARHQSIQERFSAATAEGGRTLNALKKAKAATEEAQTFNDYIKGATGKSVDDLKMEAELGSRLNSPQQLSKFIMESRKATTGDMLIEAWINGLLSGPATHVTNVVSNVATALWNIPETAVAAAIGKLHGGERVMFGEAGQELYGIVQGSREGLFVAAKAFKEETTTTPGKVDLARQRAIPGALGRGVRVPGRLLSSEDEFFKAIGRRQALNRIAYRKASQEGLKGADHSARVAELVENPTDAMKTYAEEQAAYQTFTNPLGPLGQGLQDIQAANKAIRLVLTFVRTPLNIAKYTLKDRTPLGLLSKELRDDMAGANGPIARDTAIARMAVGTAVGVTAISMAARGLITGGGPSDAKEKALLYATGWQPYSFKVGGMYYSYARIEPLGTILGIPANLYEASQDDKNEGFSDVAGMFVASLAKNMASKTSLTGLMDLVQAVEDPDRYGARYLDKLGGTLIPSVMAQYARTQDPYLRETADFVDTLKSRVPGLRETLLPRRDIWGEAIKLEGGLGPDLISPIYESRLKNDPVTRELITLGITPSQPDKQIKGADLSPALYDEYQMVAGRLAKTTLDGIVGQPGWTDQPAFVRREVITNTMERTRRMAAGYMQMKHPELIQAAVENRIKAVTGVEK